MAVSDELTTFVKEALARRVPRAEIQAALLGAGWPADHVKRALAGFAESDFPIPVPRPAAYGSARDAFVYGTLFVTLTTTAFYLGDVVFELINRALPDPADPPYYRSTLQAIRWSVSGLIVVFPVFLFMLWHVSRAVQQDPTRRASKVRQGATYLTLFVASLVLIGDVTALVYSFLGGELTLRFVLKVITVAVIAGAVFAYYLSELRSDAQELAA
jgi:hypothetical protein